MRFLSLLIIPCWQALAAGTSPDLIDSATVYIQAVGFSLSAPSPLASIEFNPSTLSAEIITYEAPDFIGDSSEDLPIFSDDSLLRIGIYDEATSRWKSSTSMTSIASFSKGYAPTIIISLDSQGGILGVSCKSAVIDAGQTRDFGPKVLIRSMDTGKRPELNRPVVLSAEGKLEEPAAEKTMLQK